MKNKITPCIWSLISNTHLRKAESLEILIRALLLNNEEINQNFKNKWLKIYKNKNWKPIGDLNEHLKLAAQLGVTKTDILTPGQQKINILAKLVNSGIIKIREYISIILFNLVSFINYEYRHIFKMTLELLKKQNNSPVSVDEIFQNFNFGEPVCAEFNIKLLRYNLKQKDHIFYILISGVFFEVLSSRGKNQQYNINFFKIKLYDHWYSRIDELIKRCNNQLESYNFEKASLIRLDSEKWSNYLTQNSQANYDYIVDVLMQKESNNLDEKNDNTINFKASINHLENQVQKNLENSLQETQINQDISTTISNNPEKVDIELEAILENSQENKVDLSELPVNFNDKDQAENHQISFENTDLTSTNSVEKLEIKEKIQEKQSDIRIISNNLEQNCCPEQNVVEKEIGKTYEDNIEKNNSFYSNFYQDQFERDFNKISEPSGEKNLQDNTQSEICAAEKCCNRIQLEKENLEHIDSSKQEKVVKINSNYLNKGENNSNSNTNTNKKVPSLPLLSQAKQEMQREISKYPISKSVNSKEQYYNYFIHKINKLFNFSLENILNKTNFKQNFFNILDFHKKNHEIILKPKKTIIKSGKNLLLISPSANLIYSKIKNELCKTEISEKNYEIVTFFDDYNPESFIGYNDFVLGSKEKLNFIPGPFARILHKAYWNPEKKYCLILENIDNDAAKITLAPLKPLFIRGENGESFLGISQFDLSFYIFSHPEEKNFIPGNLTIIGTVNSNLDRDFVDLSPDFLENWEIKYLERDNLYSHITKYQICDTGLSWKHFSEKLNSLLESENLNNKWFLPNQIETKILENPRIFVDKVLFSLWNFTSPEKRKIIFRSNSYSVMVKEFLETKGSKRLNIFKFDYEKIKNI